MIGLSFFLIFFSNFLKVNAVWVKMDNISCADEGNLKETSQILGKNILLIATSKIEKQLKEKYLCIKSVKFNKRLPREVEMEVSARVPVAQVLVIKETEASPSAILDTFSTSSSPSAIPVDKSFLVDSEGVIFSKDAQNLNYPKVYVEEEITSVKEVLKIIEKLKIFGMEIKESRVVGQKTLLINPQTSEPKIIFALDNLDIQLASLQLILKKAKIDEVTIEFIDLRFDKPIVRFAPKKK